MRGSMHVCRPPAVLPLATSSEFQAIAAGKAVWQNQITFPPSSANAYLCNCLAFLNGADGGPTVKFRASGSGAIQRRVPGAYMVVFQVLHHIRALKARYALSVKWTRIVVPPGGGTRTGRA